MKMRHWNIFMPIPNRAALYTIMCDVVAGALDKIKELKEKEDKQEQLAVIHSLTNV